MGLFDKLFGGGAKPAASKPAAPVAKSTPEWATQSGVPQELAAREAVALFATDDPPTILDVRDDEELYQSGRIPGSISIPMHEIQGRQTEIDHEKHVVVYCASGMRSMEVGAFLLQAGFKQVSNLNGGLNAWPGPKEEVPRP